MTKTGRREFARRIVVMALLVLGLAMAAHGQYPLAVLMLAGAVVFYIFLPAVPSPEKALVQDAGRSWTGSDWTGFILSSGFFAFPIWAAVSAPEWGAIHPSAMVLWPMGLITSSFWIIGALNASFQVLIKADRLVISSAFSRTEARFDNIAKVRRYSRGLPGWLYFLAPLMIMKGQYGAAGSLLLARKRNGMELVMKDGRKISIPGDGFEMESIKILKALARRGVKLAASLQTLLKKNAEKTGR